MIGSNEFLSGFTLMDPCICYGPTLVPLTHSLPNGDSSYPLILQGPPLVLFAHSLPTKDSIDPLLLSPIQLPLTHSHPIGDFP